MDLGEKAVLDRQIRANSFWCMLLTTFLTGTMVPMYLFASGKQDKVYEEQEDLLDSIRLNLESNFTFKMI